MVGALYEPGVSDKNELRQLGVTRLAEAVMTIRDGE